MTRIALQKIFEKIQRLDEYLSYLNKLKKEIKSEKNFLADFHFFGLAERYLQLSCQAVIDIMNLLIIEKGLEKPDTGQEIVDFLFNKSVISEDLSFRLEGVVGFRNILVHEYGKIDHKRVYKYLQQKLKDFEIFKTEILRLLDQEISNN